MGLILMAVLIFVINCGQSGFANWSQLKDDIFKLLEKDVLMFSSDRGFSKELLVDNAPSF